MQATSRVVGCSINTVRKLMLDAGDSALVLHNHLVQDIAVERVECDEMWAFCYAREQNLGTATAAPPDAGSFWTWTALDPDTKLMLTWHVGDRGLEDANEFMIDLAARLANRVQLTTDGWHAYAEAVAGAFLGDVDYAQLVKHFEGGDGTRFAVKTPLTGDPAEGRISTSMVERMNYSMRMGMKRYARLGDAFSKRLRHHCAMLALYFLYYNFMRPHTSLRELTPRTPAMAAGLTSKPQTLDWLLDYVDATAPKPNRPKRYRKK